MLRDIEGFLSAEVTIERLSASLKLGVAAMAAHGAAKCWIEELRTLRNEIEYVSASWLESGRTTLDQEERRVAVEVAIELQAALSDE